MPLSPFHRNPDCNPANFLPQTPLVLLGRGGEIIRDRLAVAQVSLTIAEKEA
ncbi:MAG: hypothetical protein WBQ45_03580 [Roseiarcus sp.]|jgi:hypothetical protein